jgi:hypothetical protein
MASTCDPMRGNAKSGFKNKCRNCSTICVPFASPHANLSPRSICFSRSPGRTPTTSSICSGLNAGCMEARTRLASEKSVRFAVRKPVPFTKAGKGAAPFVSERHCFVRIDEWIPCKKRNRWKTGQYANTVQYSTK